MNERDAPPESEGTRENLWATCRAVELGNDVTGEASSQFAAQRLRADSAGPGGQWPARRSLPSWSIRPKPQIAPRPADIGPGENISLHLQQGALP